LRRAFGHKWFSGHYTLWSDARAKTQGYEEQSVLTRVLAATREVVAGYALWERDGATFTTVEINVPLVTVLRRIASIENGRLDLIDFGGALGSTWRQHLIALEEIPTIRWRVVEQPHYVEAGKEFENTTLSFNPSLQAALEVGTVSTVLLSSVMPYIESPQELLGPS
jgi:putative methyltransferase (TIGR04325 family)